MPIVVSREADRVVNFAARELKKYLQEISKALFTIKKSVDIDMSLSSSAIVVGSGEWEERNDFTLDPNCAPFDGFAIRSLQNKLFVRGTNSRSSLYGVYALLEELGCEFVEPGIEHIPQSQCLMYSSPDITDVAAFPLRTVYPNLNHVHKKAPFKDLDPKVLLPQIDWMAKRRLNHYVFYVNFYRYELWEKHKMKILEEMLDRGFDLEVTHHSLHFFCPPDENHDFGDYGPSTYIRNHPNWYVPALECGGRGRWQTRVDLPAVQKVVIKRYLEYIEHNPELEIIGLWPDDIPMNAPYKGLGITDGYLKFWNKAGEALARAFPEKRLATCAYLELITPPNKVVPNPNLHQWFCPISRSYSYGIDDKRNKEFLSYLREWVKQMSPYHLGIFEYYGWQMELKPLLEVMRNDMQVYRDLGVGGVYAWSGFVNNVLGDDYRWAMDLFCLTHLLWNPQADLEGPRRTWAENVFGRAASAILDFHDLLRKEHAKEVRKGLSPIYQWICFDLMHKCQKILAAARKKAGSPRIMRRIDLLEKMLTHGSAEEICREGQARLM